MIFPTVQALNSYSRKVPEMKHPIYFDNAATTFPKPVSVVNAVSRVMRESCGNPGRGSHKLAREAANILYNCREEIASLIGLSDPTRVCFTRNTTEALNTAIKGFLRAGDHVLISDLEHNSVWRPIAMLSKQRGVSYDVFSSAAMQIPENIENELRMHLKPKTRAIICTHASNICSRTLPLREIGAFCKKHRLLFIVDGAQSIGHLPLDMEEMQITALCAPGHKGLYGPQGSGFLALSASLSENELPSPLTEGGSGYQSLLPEMPALPPERYEAGTAATPAIAGLSAGIRFVREIGIRAVAKKEEALYTVAREYLSNMRGVRVYAPEAVGSVLSFSVKGRSAEEIADLFDKDGICVRAGFHCAALAHKALGTPRESGTVRLGFGYFNTPDEIRTFVSCLNRML